jgi:hypothetical protein
MSNLNNRDNYDRSNYNDGNVFTRKRNRKDSDEARYEKPFKPEKKKSPDEEDYESKFDQNKYAYSKIFINLLVNFYTRS